MTFAEALLALTLNLFFEARGEGVRGMEAVADVTITRVHDKRYPNNVQDVVLQSRQFSWTRQHLKGRKDFFGLVSLQNELLHSGKMKPADLKRYKEAEAIARKVLREGYKPRYRFTHFHTIKIRPYWVEYRSGMQIGNHIFYRF